jgi:hypothetical protein
MGHTFSEMRFDAEWVRLREQHRALLREHAVLQDNPRLDHFGHFRRLEKHRRELRDFRRTLWEKRVALQLPDQTW